MIAKISDQHVEKIVEMLRHDIEVTVGGVYDNWARRAAEAERQLFDEWRASEAAEEEKSDLTVQDFYVRVAERFQQEMHDQFVDTSWPRCPDHSNHPLWLHGTAWICEPEFARIGNLGDLPPQAA